MGPSLDDVRSWDGLVMGVREIDLFPEQWEMNARDTLNKNGEGFSGSCRRSFTEVPRLSEPISRMFRPPSWLRRGRCGL